MACGGRTLDVTSGEGQDASDSSSSDDQSANGRDAASSANESSSGGTSSGSAFPICPNVAPKAGWSCPTPNQGCAFVDYDTGACVSFVCDSGGHWASSTPAGC